MKIKFRIAVYMLFLLPIGVAAQDWYELQYRFNGTSDTNLYETCLVLSGNGTGMARIKTGTTLLEMELQEQPSGDTSFVLYTGTTINTVKGKLISIKGPHYFWLRNTGNLYFTPWASMQADTAAAPAESNLLKGSYLPTEELVKNKPMVKGYFDSTHYIYKNLFAKQNTKGGFPFGIEAKDTRMFLLIVASTYDSTLAPDVLQDARKVVNAFTDIAENGLGIRIFVDSVYGSRYNKASVETALSKLKPGKNDIVIFYYSGHGFTDQKQPKKQFPFLDLRDPNKRPRPEPIKMALNIEDIYKTIVAKGARMNLVLSDCCNDTVEIKKPKTTLKPPASKGPVRFFTPNMASLFMQKKPMNLLFTAASRDERAIITEKYNSYFTHFFLESLKTYMSPAKNVPNWYLVMEDAKRLTSLYAGKVTCPSGKPCKQTPKQLL